jgi:hypothetical protein
MGAKKTQRIAKQWKLTQVEATESRRLRELVERDKDEIIALGRLYHVGAKAQETLSQITSIDGQFAHRLDDVAVGDDDVVAVFGCE